MHGPGASSWSRQADRGPTSRLRRVPSPIPSSPAFTVIDTSSPSSNQVSFSPSLPCMAIFPPSVNSNRQPRVRRSLASLWKWLVNVAYVEREARQNTGDEIVPVPMRSPVHSPQPDDARCASIWPGDQRRSRRFDVDVSIGSPVDLDPGSRQQLILVSKLSYRLTVHRNLYLHIPGGFGVFMT